MYYDDELREIKSRKRLALGLVFIIAGALALLRNMHMLPEFICDIVFTWQMLLIAIGVVTVTNPRKRMMGLVLIAIGGFFLASELFYIPLNFQYTFWPVILIVAGVLYLLFGSRKYLRNPEEF